MKIMICAVAYCIFSLNNSIFFLGDFAILIQSGMSFRRALSFNFLSACTAFIGLVIGICLGNMEYSGFVFSFAGGLFLFITLTHLVS